jgi:hypothetical protein
MMDAWEIYLEEFRTRGARAHGQRFGRQEGLTEAAHDAYQAAADRMTREHGWSDDHTLVVMRGLNDAVRGWLHAGAGDWDELGRSCGAGRWNSGTASARTPPPGPEAICGIVAGPPAGR